MKNSDSDASQQITNHIAELNDWRGAIVSRLRDLINVACPELTEEWKWNTPVWSLKGNVVALGAFKDHVKIKFFKGASLEDPHALFNCELDAKTSRTIDIREGDSIDEPALTELIRAATILYSGEANVQYNELTVSTNRSSWRPNCKLR